MTRSHPPFPLPGVWRSVATACCPPAAALDASAWDEVEQLAGAALARRPAAVTEHLRWFLAALPWLALVLAGRPFAHLSPVRQVRVLRQLERSPVPAFRRGIWGLRTLAFLGVYGRPSMRDALGWRPDARGWEGRTPADLVRRTPPTGQPSLRLVP